MTHRIAVENDQTAVSMPRGYKSFLRRAAAMTLSAAHFERRAEIGVSMVDLGEIRRLNREHRGIDRPTDVLSFPLTDDPFQPRPEDLFRGCVTLGDVIVCPEVIAAQAKENGVSFREELARMVIHSVLHLLGRDHAEENEKKEMFDMQETILAEWMKTE